MRVWVYRAKDVDKAESDEVIRPLIANLPTGAVLKVEKGVEDIVVWRMIRGTVNLDEYHEENWVF